MLLQVGLTPGRGWWLDHSKGCVSLPLRAPRLFPIVTQSQGVPGAQPGNTGRVALGWTVSQEVSIVSKGLCTVSGQRRVVKTHLPWGPQRSGCGMFLGYQKALAPLERAI